MHDTTTIRVRRETAAELRELADEDNKSMDAELRFLARRERQRRMGAALATAIPDSQDEAWLVDAARVSSEHAGG